MNPKWLKGILAGGALLAITVVVGVYGVSIVQASTSMGSTTGSKSLAHPGIGNGTIDMQALLAEELGVSVEELEAAKQAAFEASIAAAVDEGKLTQEQADQILERDGFFGRVFGRHGFGMRGFGPGGPENGDSHTSLLAGELGITAEELQAAQQSASEAAMQQLVDEGILTEEQAANAKAAAELKAYLSQASLAAKALGMSTAEWEAAKEAGKSLSEILEEQGMDAASFRENLAAAKEAAIEQAVSDGVISQEEADNLESGRPFGFRSGRGFGSGRGGRHPFGPRNAPQEDTSNTLNA